MTRVRAGRPAKAGGAGILLVSIATLVGCTSPSPPVALPATTPSPLFCDNARQLVAVATSSETPSPSRESVDRGIETVRSLVGAMGETGAADVGASDWTAVADAYGDVQRAFREATGDTGEGDFIWTLAVAADKQDSAVTAWRDAVQKKCGVDLAPLRVGG